MKEQTAEGSRDSAFLAWEEVYSGDLLLFDISRHWQHTTKIGEVIRKKKFLMNPFLQNYTFLAHVILFMNDNKE